MPTPTLEDLIITWFPVVEHPHSARLDPPICQEVVAHRRAWTAERDLISASNDQEIWRKPTDDEMLDWALFKPQEGQLPGEARWLVATTGEPGLGVPTRMAVRLQERVAS